MRNDFVHRPMLTGEEYAVDVVKVRKFNFASNMSQCLPDELGYGAQFYIKQKCITVLGNMNVQNYIHNVLEVAIPYLQQLHNPFAQQDNARFHIAAATTSFFRNSQVPGPPRCLDFSHPSLIKDLHRSKYEV